MIFEAKHSGMSSNVEQPGQGSGPLLHNESKYFLSPSLSDLAQSSPPPPLSLSVLVILYNYYIFFLKKRTNKSKFVSVPAPYPTEGVLQFGSSSKIASTLVVMLCGNEPIPTADLTPTPQSSPQIACLCYVTVRCSVTT